MSNMLPNGQGHWTTPVCVKWVSKHIGVTKRRTFMNDENRIQRDFQPKDLNINLQLDGAGTANRWRSGSENPAPFIDLWRRWTKRGRSVVHPNREAP